MKTRTKIAAAAALLLTGALAILLRPAPLAVREVPAASESAPKTAGSAPAPQLEPPRVSRAPVLTNTVPDVSGKTVLERYKLWAQYPPNSRPLNEGQVDVIEPNVVAVAPHQMVHTGPDGRPIASNTFCSLQPLRHTVLEGEPLTITLSCQSGTGMGARPVPVEVTDVRLRGHNPKRDWEGLVSGAFNDQGVAPDAYGGDLEYTLQVTTQPGDWGDMQLDVSVVIQDQERKGDRNHYELRAGFSAGGKPPAQFTGNFADHLSDGSLVVEVEVSVQKPGSYRVVGNLFSNAAPVAYARNDLRLAAGVQRVPLLFFGKVLRDSGLAGPYRLVEVRGYRLNTGIDPQDLLLPAAEVERRLAQIPEQDAPDREVIASWPGEYHTHPYDSSSFSSKEWQSETKSRRIAQLSRMAENH